jgi:hypothetical protein
MFAMVIILMGGSLGRVARLADAHGTGTVEVRPMPRVGQCPASTTSQLCKHEATVSPTIAIITRFLGVLAKRALCNFLSTQNICLVP